MREELIRVENGCFRREDEFYRFEISISRGECIGVYVDDHFTSGTAYLDLFKGGTHLERGRAFSCGRRVGPLELERWILQNARIVNWHRFHSQELTVRDFLLALDRPAGWPQRWGAVRRLHSPESQEIRQRMELRVPLESRLADLSLPLCISGVVLAGRVAGPGPDHRNPAAAGCGKTDGVRTAAAAPRDGGIPAGSGRDIHVPLL